MFITTTKQIFEIAEWRSERHIEFQLYSPVLDKNLRVFLYFDPKAEKKEIKPLTLKSIMEFQKITEADLRKIEDMMWEKLKENNATHKASYDDGKTWQEYTLEGNLKYIGVESKEEMIAYVEEVTFEGLTDEIIYEETLFYKAFDFVTHSSGYSRFVSTMLTYPPIS